ncbi:bifunctional chorismate mutase/prephenate dehydratase [Candidatus Schmidhempelia bombi]|uniref:Bifunctional chorismate mutase/prephenate dehydratase n=1 Tax=Candidatus Schmidhempelia bombi str. Bimp TaxID=1387197 RepID=A0AB94IDP9_9GAMM|nr:bifunctional chorismate mutase/prephenate dehydratase [Candidatus Schmidhempelia bombi]TEA27591.1 bifunctional chorismate mutase/prephenate dehydratase [Candidatus Schmidhempelia bombi str. Bimp]
MSKNSLHCLQSEIDNLDKKLLQLLAARRDIATEISNKKIEANLPLRDIDHENFILKAWLAEGQKYQLDEYYISRLCQMIVEENILAEQKILQQHINASTLKIAKFAFLGPKGSYSHLAARRYANIHLDQLIECSCTNFSAVFQQLEDGFVDYSIVPIENSSSGSINEVYDLLQKTNLHIIGEIALPIDHCILATKHTNITNIDTVYSHAQPFQQCTHFLASYPHWKIVYCDSTSSAMKMVAELNQPNVAAIGNKEGGALYGLHVLNHNFADQKQNITRFIVLARKAIDVSSQIPAKTTILMKTGQHSGALVDALLVLRKYNIAMTKLESRPIHGNPWEEMFYIDLQGNLSSLSMQQALKALSSTTLFFKILGCYPSASLLPIV